MKLNKVYMDVGSRARRPLNTYSFVALANVALLDLAGDPWPVGVAPGRGGACLGVAAPRVDRTGSTQHGSAARRAGGGWLGSAPM